jgi:hypothetical protein
MDDTAVGKEIKGEKRNLIMAASHMSLQGFL